MKTYNVACPICGHLNRNLILEETDGWMECEKCKQLTRSMKMKKMIKIPVFSVHRKQEAVVACLAK